MQYSGQHADKNVFVEIVLDEQKQHHENHLKNVFMTEFIKYD